MATLSSPSLGKLISNVRNMLNQPNPANSFWTDLELTEYLNEAVRMYFAEVIKNAEGHFVTTSDLSIVTDTETVALPADFFQAKALYIQRNNGWDILPYMPDVTNGFYTSSGQGPSLYTPYYFFRANNIVLRPTPNFTQASVLRLEYVQFPDTMVNGGDTLTNQVSPIFKQLIEMYAVYKAKLKESMVSGVDMVSIPKQNRDELYSQFVQVINKRSQYPEYVRPFNPEGSY